MKISIIWKWWAWKTTISVLMIKLLSEHKKIIAIDADSNKNLIDYLWFDNCIEKKELWDLKKEIFDLAWVSNNEYERKYSPKNWKYVFNTLENDSIFSQVAYKNNNINLIQLWEPKSCRVWVTWMCPYNETIKVYLANLKEKDDEIVWIDYAAWSEVAWKWIIASSDNIIIPLEPNSKNLDVAKDIIKTLKHIEYKNIYFVLNKIRNQEDIEFIQNEFDKNINIIWIIPFSKEIMKMDIKRNLNLESIDDSIKQNLQDLLNNILSLKQDKNEVLKRLEKLDLIKWDKKVH